MKQKEIEALLNLLLSKHGMGHFSLDTHGACRKYLVPDGFSINNLDSRLFCNGTCDY